MKRWSTSLSGKCKSKPQWETHHLTPVRMAIIKNTTRTSIGEDVENRDPSFTVYWWECKLMQPLWKRGWRVLKKLKTELLYDRALPLLYIYPEKTKTLMRKDICALTLIALLFIIAKICKQPKCPSTDEWIKKMWYLNTHVRILLSHKK